MGTHSSIIGKLHGQSLAGYSPWCCSWTWTCSCSMDITEGLIHTHVLIHTHMCVCIYKYMYETESLCSIPEANTTL